MSSRIFFGELLAGPIVAIIFVLRIVSFTIVDFPASYKKKVHQRRTILIRFEKLMRKSEVTEVGFNGKTEFYNVDHLVSLRWNIIKISF